MYPCSTCDRHLRESDRLCPFCGTVQVTVTSPGLGALLTVALLGSTACARDPSAEGSTAGTTTTMTTMTTTATESGETSTSTETTISGDGDGDGDDASTTNTINTSGSFYAGPEIDENWDFECDPFAQDCPDGEKCVPYSSTGGVFDANKCVPILGDGQPGEPCDYGGVVESTDDCAGNSFCWTNSDTGVCIEFCQNVPDDPVCPMGLQCTIADGGSLNLCTSPCNPLMQDCSPEFACYWDNLHFSCVPTSENLALGDPCGAINDCAPGLICTDTEFLPNCAGDSCCASSCDLSAPMCPQMGTECAAFFEGDPPPMGLENVGLCVIP
jgi:hypothetical protein